MKIALVTTSFLPVTGGAEVLVHNMARHWSEQGHEVWVLNTTTDQPGSEEMRYRVVRYPYLRGSSLLRQGTHRFPFANYGAHVLKRALRAIGPDVISGHFGYPVGIWLSRIKPVPKFLITCHGPELWDTPWGYRRRYHIDSVLAQAMNASAGAVAMSRYAREQMEAMGVRAEKIVDIPNGIDVKRFRRRIDLDLRARLGVPPEAVLVLSVGRNAAQKAYDVALRVFSKAAKQSTDVYYAIVGSGATKLASQCSGWSGCERVVLSDGLYGDDLAALYQQADIFLSSSIAELCPLVVLEAIAAGLPAVVTRVGGSEDIIREGQNGFLAEPGQEDTMAEALGKLIDDAELRRRIAANNREYAEKYSLTTMCRRYLEQVLS